MDAHTAFREQLDRLDMATLTAIGMVKPADLVTIRDRYLDGFIPHAVQQRAAWRARMLGYVEAHKHLVPIPPPSPHPER